MANNYEITKSYKLEKLDIIPCRNIPTDLIGEGKMSNGETKIKFGTPISLVGIFDELTLFHDIDSMVNSGYITITEQGNAILDLPIMGWERIDIKFSIETENNIYKPYERKFFVYGVDNVSETGDTRKYTIRFASMSALINVATKIEKRYIGTPDEIIKEICDINAFKVSEGVLGDGQWKEYPGYFPVEKSCIDLDLSEFVTTPKTKPNLDIIASCKTPFSFMKYIADIAQDNQLGAFSDCLLFQQTNGKLVFTSYANISIKNSVFDFYKTPWVNDSSKNIPVSNYKYSIVDYSFNKLFNSQDSCSSGMMGNVTKILDFSTMTVKTFENFYSLDTSNANNKKHTFLTGTGLPTALVTEIPSLNGVNPNTKSTILGPEMNAYRMTSSSSEDGREYRAFKQSPVANISVYGAGINQANANPLTQAQASSGLAPNTIKIETAKSSLAMGKPYNINMRTASILFELNPCTDLELGKCVNIKMNTPNNSKAVSEFINGIWYIGKIKYTLTLSDIKVFVTCYTNTNPSFKATSNSSLKFNEEDYTITN